MLWNNISEILCCLDFLERGYQHTVLNNLRMFLEGFCLVFDIYKNDKTFQSYQNSNYDVCKSISFMSKYGENYKALGRLYGELSKISRQLRFEFVARQFTKPLFGLLAITHIKVIKDIFI